MFRAELPDRDLDQGAFSRTVPTEQYRHASRGRPDAGGAQHGAGAERFPDLLGGEDRFHGVKTSWVKNLAVVFRQEGHEKQHEHAVQADRRWGSKRQ